MIRRSKRYPVPEPTTRQENESWAHNLMLMLMLTLNDEQTVALKRALARRSGQRFYGNGGTIHSTGHLDVETRGGKVVAVWFRCQMLPFNQVEVDGDRAVAMVRAIDLPSISGVEVSDRRAA
jgi:hypothetical protein